MKTENIHRINPEGCETLESRYSPGEIQGFKKFSAFPKLFYIPDHISTPDFAAGLAQFTSEHEEYLKELKKGFSHSPIPKVGIIHIEGLPSSIKTSNARAVKKHLEAYGARLLEQGVIDLPLNIYMFNWDQFENELRDPKYNHKLTDFMAEGSLAKEYGEVYYGALEAQKIQEALAPGAPDDNIFLALTGRYMTLSIYQALVAFQEYRGPTIFIVDKPAGTGYISQFSKYITRDYSLTMLSDVAKLCDEHGIDKNRYGLFYSGWVSSVGVYVFLALQRAILQKTENIHEANEMREKLGLPKFPTQQKWLNERKLARGGGTYWQVEFASLMADSAMQRAVASTDLLPSFMTRAINGNDIAVEDPQIPPPLKQEIVLLQQLKGISEKRATDEVIRHYATGLNYLHNVQPGVLSFLGVAQFAPKLNRIDMSYFRQQLKQLTRG